MSELSRKEMEGFLTSIENLDDIFRRKRKAIIEVMDEAWAAFKATSDEQKKKWEALNERRRAVCTKYGSLEASPNDMLHLNVGGCTELCCLRSTLTLAHGSMFSAMFLGRWDKRLPRDKEGRIFVDEDPYVFRMLVDHLKSVKDCQQNPGTPLPSIPTLSEDKVDLWKYFLGFWGLQEFMQEGSVISPMEGAAETEGPSETNQPTLSFGPLHSILHKGDEVLAKEDIRLKKCLEAFEAEEAFMLRYLQPEDPVVGLNVSGKVFTVSLRVLQCFPDSVLAITFDRKRWTEQMEDLDKSGNYLMEYDTYCFMKLLEVMRVKVFYDIPDPWVNIDKAYVDEMLNLVKYLFPGQEKDILKSFCPQFSSQEIQDAITTFLPGCNFELLYRASWDGWDSTDFHHLCDHQGPTVTVLTSSGGHIFGGYAQQSWTSRGDWVIDPNAFIFTVKSHDEDLGPTKLALKKGREHRALYDLLGAGPTFGQCHDIHVSSGANRINGCSSRIDGYTYQLPRGRRSTFFTGRQNFSLAQVEVYKVRRDDIAEGSL